MGRLRRRDRDELNDRERELYDRIAAKRGAVRGPFNAWLYSPELCARVEALGKFVRFDTDIPMRLKEIAVLVIARHFTSQYMWQAHVRFASKEDVTQTVIDAIATKQTPNFPQVDELVVYNYTRELLENHQISDATWAAAVDLLDEARVVEFTACIGNFSMVALALNAFKVDLPEGIEPLLS